jgi:hypothetical protein
MLREVEDEVAERAPAEGLRRAVDRVYMRVLGESGATRPSPQVLAELSRVLEVPGEFFALSLVETHEGFFRSTRRTSVAHRRHARSLAHIAHDLATSEPQERNHRLTRGLGVVQPVATTKPL